MSKRFNSATLTTARHAASDDYSPIDGATNNTRKISPFDAHGQFRNALAPRGGVAFDGTTSPNTKFLTSASAALAIGTDPRTIAWGMKVPAASPAGSKVMWVISEPGVEGAYSMRSDLGNGGTLKLWIFSATGGTLLTELTNFFTTYGGKDIQLAFVCSSASRVLYVNGLPVTLSADVSAGTPPTNWQGAIGGSTVALKFVGDTAYVLRYAAVFNLALSAADVLEIYELDGAIPERLKNPQVGVYGWASQVAVTPTPAIGSWTGSVVGNVITAATASTGFIAGNIIPNPTWKAGRYRIKYDLVINSGLAPNVGDGNTIATARLTAGTGNTIEVTNIGPNQLLYTNNFAAGDFVLTIVSIVLIGAVLHLPADDGLGFQLQDISSNRLHALMTASGVSHVAPLYGPARLRASSSTNGNQQLGGQVVIPGNSQIIRGRARAQSNTPTVTLGTASAGSQVVASVALTTSWKDLTIALTGGMVGSSNISLWAGSNSADVVEWDITWEPLSL